MARRLLIVENDGLQYRTLRTTFLEEGWVVERAEDKESALRAVTSAVERNEQPDLVLVDLGLPPGPNDPFRGGLPLIEELRATWPPLPIGAYTALSPQNFAYDRALKRLLPRRVSLLWLRQVDERELVRAVELAWRGYCVLSPAPADYLEQAVADRPDPLEDVEWAILKGISDDQTDREIARGLESLQHDAVRKRVSVVKQKLIDGGWLRDYQTHREDLKQWYRRHHVRFSRP